MAEEDSKQLEYLFIINPVAGRRHMTELAARIEEVFTGGNMKDHYAIVLTDRGGHAIELASAFADKYRSIDYSQNHLAAPC